MLEVIETIYFFLVLNNAYSAHYMYNYLTHNHYCNNSIGKD